MLFVAEILQPEREKSRVALFLAGTVDDPVCVGAHPVWDRYLQGNQKFAEIPRVRHEKVVCKSIRRRDGTPISWCRE